jgi:hypothetical protein
MSVKIYNGFRYEGSIYQFLRTVESFRPYVLDAARKQLERFLAGNEPRHAALMSWLDRRVNMANTRRRDPEVDTTFDLTIFPRAGWPLGIAYTEHEDWLEEWLKQPRVTEYAYWNNADRPKGVHAREWGRRRVAWERALLDSGRVPAMQGLTISVSDPNGPTPERRPD